MTMEGREAHPWSPTPAPIASVRCLPLLRAVRRRRPFVGCGTWERKPHQKGASDEQESFSSRNTARSGSASGFEQILFWLP